MLNENNKTKLNMKKKLEILIVVISAFILSVFFHRQSLGINLLITELILFLVLTFTRQIKFQGKNQITCYTGFLITSLFTVLTNSIFSIIINFLALFILIGIIIYPDAKSLINSFALSFLNLFNSQIRFLKELSDSKYKGQSILSYLWRSRIFIIPLFIIIIFIVIYRLSNPIFDKLVISANRILQERFISVFKDFDLLFVITFLISLIISNYIFLRTSNQNIIKNDFFSNDFQIRIKKNSHNNFKFNGLKNEYKAGVFLLIILNLILLIINIIDIKWVWFNFTWNGQYLKQFVHEGTYLLILSIIISIILVLFIFRGNLNFYTKNKLLKNLSYCWLAQNAILTISVAIRNFRYINYFALAYKRIGVIIFLVLTLYGLYTVFIKVHYNKTSFYLFKSNAFVLYIILIISSSINWDTLIAKYNFKHSDKSFLHLDFLSTLSDKSLPYLDKSFQELLQIDKIQKEKFPFEEKFMSPEEYHHIIEKRKIDFINKWKSKNFLSWNLPEYLAFKKLRI
jgi:hypothetical protein